ncbi:MAG: phosphoenolpyruvate--protein phosphotransferase [Sneathiella sp.]|jgi:phosphotransferase system enzyme I (PtsP)|uniref:phosphoenolpyruvate--protein phosphotransferase n=1 Tax=Sneathiella sp. TaxID=1964365 RepID=UPI000C4340F0|nr:phosphoenolpyruvate--protein phosphotransferase [Sneathiella sp.]MAL78434.1 phosphoenolpyruvate--protein phosphotransferase [Sneathiella sp.]
MSGVGISAPRLLLRKLHQVMAGHGDAEQRLSEIVHLIANNMIAEVCSCYLRRAGDVLELFATQGLKPSAVHQTRLRFGEGLVGDIAARARPLNLSDAQSHPQFAYRPETGEEEYHSLLGTPILRGGRVIGVLVVQNRTRRTYTDEEVEALQTVAMVVAELVSSEQMIAAIEFSDAAGNATLPHHINGRVLAEGLGAGAALLHEPRIEVIRTIAEDRAKELHRLEAAISAMQSTVDKLLVATDTLFSDESKDIFEAYKMFAYDKGWLKKLQEAVKTGLTAEAAIKRVQDDTRARMKEITDPYLRERLSELDDLANRLYLHLDGRTLIDRRNLEQDTVVVARNMGAAELLDYDRRRLKAVILEEGTRSSHVAIVARALGVPVVGQCADILENVEQGDLLLVDGEHGQVFLRPGEDVQQAFARSQQQRAQREAKYAALRDKPNMSLDGVPLSLNVNAGLLIDIDHFPDLGADGIGLFRTELQFMVRSQMPKVDQQTELYSRVLEKMGASPVVFRTLDIGGDKLLPYLKTRAEENPALGWRAIRIGLDRPALLRSQLRALVRAGAGRDISIMFPMIAEVSEFMEAKAILNKEIERAGQRANGLPKSIQVGTMIEVPSIIWQLPHLLGEVDFISVGSNDLMQFFFAVDRGNPKVTDRYDSLSPSLLLLLRTIAEHCEVAGKPFSICGDIAGRPLEAMALLGLGYRNFSMSAETLGRVKEMALSADIGRLENFVRGLCHSRDRSVRDQLRAFAQDHGIII